MIQGIGQEDSVGEIAMIMCVLLNLPKCPLFGPVENVSNGLEDLSLRLVILVVLAIRVHDAAEDCPIGGDSDGSSHQFVAVDDE